MANYCGTGRSNYFKVKDQAAFENWADNIGLNYELRNGEYVFFGHDEHGDPPSGPDEDEGFDFFTELQKHIADGETVIFMASGAEKLRHVGGYAVALANKGKITSFGLQDIYDRAKKRWPQNRMTAAAY